MQAKTTLALYRAIAGTQVVVAIVYTWTGGQKEKNTEICRCLPKDIEDFCQGAEIIVVGDFNAHVENLDSHTDANGRLLLELAESAELLITNLTEKCCGATTWSTRDRRSCIDYCLMTEPMYEGLNKMEQAIWLVTTTGYTWFSKPVFGASDSNSLWL